MRLRRSLPRSPSRFSLLAAVLLAGFAAAGCDGNPNANKPTSPDAKELREIVLREPSPEDPNGDPFGALRYSHREMLTRIRDVAKDAQAKGLFLQLGPLGGAWARSVELREALLAVRAAKKPVHCYFEEADNASYALLASVCDRLTITPTGIVSLVGLHAQVMYAKEALASIGLRADLLQVGRFKGAADALTRDDMPPEVRETLNALLDDLQASLTRSVAEGRKLGPDVVQKLIDAGPQSSQVALDAKLVDAVAFDDEARAIAKKAAGASEIRVISDHEETESKGLFDLLKTLSSEDKEKMHGKRIALAYLTGTIGNSEEDGGSGSNAGPFIRAMHRIADDADIKALVLRISSPGGSALASDRMWHALQRVAKRKPVIVSVGDMAASGGYYVACAGTEIFAEDSSLVGSIGVVGGKLVFQDLANRVGVHFVELARGKNSGWMSSTQPFSESERVALLGAMKETYQTFLSRVSAGRHLTMAQLAPVVEGRIMSGERARKGGLVDTQGGLEEAIAAARKKGGLEADAPIEVWPKKRSFFERIAGALGGGDARALALDGMARALPELAQPGILQLLARGEHGAFATPAYSLTIR